MSAALRQPSHRHLARAWLRWGVCFALVVAVHAAALVALRREIPALGTDEQDAIIMDLAPPAPPEQAPIEPTPAEPAPTPPDPTQPAPVPEEVPPPEPTLQPPPVPDTPPPVPDAAPPVPQAEVPLPPPVPKPQPPPRPHLRPKPKAPPVETLQKSAAPLTTPMPPGPAATTASSQARSTWEGQLIAHITRFKRFPPAAERRGEQGIVLMHLTVAHGGAVVAMAMVRGSGYADLDAEAQAWMIRAQPLPALPADVTAEQLEIVVPLRFTIR